MALFAAVEILPALQNEEDMRQSIRSLSAQAIAAIELDIEGRHFHHDNNADAVADFISAARDSELFYRSHEISIVGFEITIHFNGGAQIACQGSVPERHVADVALKCPGSLAGEVLVSGGRKWLDGSARART